ncbi:glycosyltransferase family 39 protein [Roseateles sp. SL47]|uniref:ArnT family glycosyltransferase n=1 Tax=Roseateles sp. SL47 TaxID=2995138 RepID=UPI0022719CF8|nr:glycosyltransferase family 39 protein [Roseateles sp. SL47]WAC74810.1 glycosyltransferase family 39 protein [Roseateles sp. SL47]
MRAAINMPALTRREWVRVALLAGIWLAWSAGLRPLELPDEGRYAGVAWEALRSGHWLVPTLNGEPFFHKPPLFYWITEAAMRLLGPTALAARAAALSGGWLAAMSLWMLLRHWAAPGVAKVAWLVLLVMPLTFLGSQYANLDMLVAGCVTATVCLAADALLRRAQGQPWRGLLLAAHGMAGVGMLAKGLIGLVLPGLIVVIWLGWRRRWRDLPILFWPPGLLLMAAVAAPWYLVMQMRFPEFLHFFFVVQHFERFSGGGFNNAMPFWFFPAVLLVASLPALPWLVLGHLGTRQGEGSDPDGITALMVVWLVVVVVFFSLPQSKLVGYILPAVPPLAALVALAWHRLQPAPRRMRMWAWASLLLSAGVSVAAVVTLTVSPLRSTRALALELRQLRHSGEPVYMLNRFDYDLPLYAGLESPVWVQSDWNRSDLMDRDNWRKELAETRYFAAGGRTPHLIDEAAVTQALCKAPVSWVVASTRDVPAHPWLAPIVPVSTRRGLSLWRITPAQLHCPIAG